VRTREFDSVLGFTEHLIALEVGLRVIERKALGAVLQVLEDDMKAQIGEYQDAAGPYPAWAALADSTEVEKERLGYPSDAPLLREGDLEKSFSHEQEGVEGVVGSTDPVMEYHEFGTPKMPPRPVVGPALERKRDKIEHLLGHALVEAIIGGTLQGGSSEIARYLGEDIKT
jgi:HK97 gp10 family phage protein